MQPLCAAQLSLLLLAAAAEETPGPLATPINAADMSTSSRSLSDERELALVQGTENYGDCRESATCRGEGFYCFKRAGGEYAQCRPRETTTCIEAGMWDPTRHSANDWLCPGWEYCAATHGDCAYAKCCQNAFDACFSRVSAPHTAHLHATRLTNTAVSSFLPHPTLTLMRCLIPAAVVPASFASFLFAHPAHPLAARQLRRLHPRVHVRGARVVAHRHREPGTGRRGGGMQRPQRDGMGVYQADAGGGQLCP